MCADGEAASRSPPSLPRFEAHFFQLILRPSIWHRLKRTTALAAFLKATSGLPIRKSARSQGRPPISRFPLAGKAKATLRFLLSIGRRNGCCVWCSPAFCSNAKAGVHGDRRLNKGHQAYSKKGKHAWNTQQKKANDIGLPRPPDATEAVHSDDGVLPRLPVVAGVVSAVVLSPGLSCSTFSDIPIIGSSSGTSSNIQDRVSAEDMAKRTRNVADLKETLASQGATERNFKLLDVETNNDGKENRTEFSIIGAKSMTFSNGIKNCGLVLVGSDCDFPEERPQE